MLLLTNCEVHTTKYSDRSADRTKWGQYKKLRSEYFPYGKNNWLTRALLYSHHEVVGKVSEKCRKADEISLEAQFCEKKPKSITTKNLEKKLRKTSVG